MKKDLMIQFVALYEENHTCSTDDDDDDERTFLFENENPFFQEKLPDNMENFLRKITNLHQRIELMKDLIGQLQKKQTEILTSISKDKLLTEEHDQLIATIKETSSYLNSDIKDLKKQTKEENDNNISKGITAEEKIKRDQINILVVLFQEVMNDYNRVQLDHRDQCKARIKRQFEIVEKDVENEEIEEMIEQGNISAFHSGFAFANLDDASQSLKIVEDRHADILKLEQSIKDLFEIFQEIAILVESQGDMIENIQRNAEETMEHVKKTKTQLKAARRYKQRTIFSICCPVFLRKSLCCTIL